MFYVKSLLLQVLEENNEVNSRKRTREQAEELDLKIKQIMHPLIRIYGKNGILKMVQDLLNSNFQSKILATLRICQSNDSFEGKNTLLSLAGKFAEFIPRFLIVMDLAQSACDESDMQAMFMVLSENLVKLCGEFKSSYFLLSCELNAAARRFS